MIDWFAGSLTKNVPMIEVMMQTPPMASGRVIMLSSTSAPAVRKKIAATREFYAKLGVDIPKGDAPPGAPVDPGLNPKIDIVATFVSSLKSEIAELDQRNVELSRQFDDEMTRAKDLAIVQIEDQERSGEIKNDDTLKRIGATYGKTAAQISLRWLVQQNVAVIPRTARIERLSENIDIFDFSLTDGEMAEIAAMGNPKGRLTDFGFAPKWD